MMADTNGDGCIDFEEFMKHFSDILDMIQYQRSLQDVYDQVRAEELARLKLGKGEDLDEVGNLAQQELKKIGGVGASGSGFMAMQSTMGNSTMQGGQSAM